MKAGQFTVVHMSTGDYNNPTNICVWYHVVHVRSNNCEIEVIQVCVIGVSVHVFVDPKC